MDRHRHLFEKESGCPVVHIVIAEHAVQFLTDVASIDHVGGTGAIPLLIIYVLFDLLKRFDREFVIDIILQRIVEFLRRVIDILHVAFAHIYFRETLDIPVRFDTDTPLQFHAAGERHEYTRQHQDQRCYLFSHFPAPINFPKYVQLYFVNKTRHLHYSRMPRLRETGMREIEFPKWEYYFLLRIFFRSLFIRIHIFLKNTRTGLVVRIKPVYRR